MTEDTKKDDTELQQDIPPSEGMDSPDASAAPSPEERIAQLEAEAAAFKDKALRALADAENTRRRAERDLGEARRYGAAGLARDLLTVADNLRRALDSVAGEAPEGGEAAKNFVVGVEMIERELLTAFEKHGIRRLDPLGEKFDPEYHQAMYELETAERPAGTVAEVLQPGYVMHDRLLRAAMVAVAKGGPTAPPEDADRVDTTA